MLWNVKSTLLDVITFTSTSETKMHHFGQFSKAAGGQNGDFQTFLDFEKTRALWDLLIVFSKITHKRLYLGKIWRKWKFWNCRRILDIYRNWLLIEDWGRKQATNKFAFFSWTWAKYLEIHLQEGSPTFDKVGEHWKKASSAFKRRFCLPRILRSTSTL